MREDLWIIVEATCRHRFVERMPDGTPIRDPYCALGLVCGPDSCPVLSAAERVMVKQAEIAGEAAGDALALHLKSTRARPS